MECRSLEWIPPKKDGILSLQNFSSRVAKRERGKIVQNDFSLQKKGIENLRPQEGFAYVCHYHSVPHRGE